MKYVSPLLFLDLIMIKKYVGVSKEAIARSGGYHFGDGELDRVTGLVIRKSWTVPSLHRFAWSSPVQLVRALPSGVPTSREIVGGIVVALVLYDFLFFVPHLLLHKVRF